jgi:hypothetical protein
MPRHNPERALRRLVADLSRLHPGDAEAILAALDADERARLDRLVAGGPEPTGAEPAWRYEGVSPWLLDRIEPEAGGRGRDFVLMTPATIEALKAAAEPFRTQAGEARGTPLIDRFLGWLAGARA